MCCGFGKVSHAVQEQTGITFSSVFSGFFVPVTRPALCSVSLSGDNCEFLFGVATKKKNQKTNNWLISSCFFFLFKFTFLVISLE